MFNKIHLNTRIIILFAFLTLSGLLFINDQSVSATKKQSKKNDAIVLNYDGETHSYTGVQGSIVFNHRDITLSTMPIVNIDGALYAPAEELLRTVLGYSFTYDEGSLLYTAYDEDIKIGLTFNAGEYAFTLNKNDTSTEISLSNPIRMIGMADNPAIACIPVKKLITTLEMTYSWDKSSQKCTIQRIHSFDQTGVIEQEDPGINHITHTSADYQINDNMASFDFHFNGDLQSSFDSTSVNRDGQIITVTMPNTVFLPEIRLYDRFGEIIDRMVISEADGSVSIVFYCSDVAEFAYTTTDNDLYLRVMMDYSSSTGLSSGHTLTIKRPSEDCLIDSVSVEDLYDAVYKKKVFKIIIKGDYEEFYDKNPITIDDDSVKKLSISLSSSGNTVIKVTTKSLRTCKVERVEGDFIATVGEPHKLFKNVLVLDAGHGEFDRGAYHFGTKEKDLNLKMIYTRMKKHFNKPDDDIKVYWTRRNDRFVTLDDRAAFAKKVHADAFISLHMNSAENGSAKGTEVYYSTQNNKVTDSGLRSSIMAEMMCEDLVWNMDTEDRGVKTANFVVVYKNTVPSILIELGFLSNKSDYKKLKSKKYQEIASKTIAGVIRDFFEEYPSR
ncbi:MAG: N-acetylmuramoyl-L-alanine amidase [Eubacterium sp.]|nr:N-acetylmuramoyl-L-alanine amidase [Eubacterium sp.]